MIAGPPAPAPLLIGQAPSSAAKDLLGSSGARLAMLCDVDLDCYAAVFARANLVQEFPGRAPSGGHLFPRAEARRGWERLLPALPGRRVVLLGSGVARVARVEAPLWHWTPCSFEGRAFELAVVPHPSGLSRWWNSPSGIFVAAAWWRALYEQATAGELGGQTGDLL